MNKHVIIFAKAPVLGTVKTRLAAGVGDVAACSFYRVWSQGVIRRINACRKWSTVIGVSPDKDAMGEPKWPHFWPPEIIRVPQGGGDLGDRMSRCFRAAPPGAAIIIGSDIPDIKTSHVEQAFGMLKLNDVVFGPSADGGYWLIGLSNRVRKNVRLTGIRWSSEFAMQDTIRSFDPSVRVGVLAQQLADIDTADDLYAWSAEKV